MTAEPDFDRTGWACNVYVGVQFLPPFADVRGKKDRAVRFQYAQSICSPWSQASEEYMHTWPRMPIAKYSKNNVSIAPPAVSFQYLYCVHLSKKLDTYTFSCFSLFSNGFPEGSLLCLWRFSTYSAWQQRRLQFCPLRISSERRHWSFRGSGLTTTGSPPHTQCKRERSNTKHEYPPLAWVSTSAHRSGHSKALAG